jgi:hypothetical protein
LSTDPYEARKAIQKVRDGLMTLSLEDRTFAIRPFEFAEASLTFAEDARIEAAPIPGWVLYFIPAQGPLAGQPIRRTFIVGPDGGEHECIMLMREKYGSASHLLAGRSLHSDSQFGVWDE